MGWRRPGYKGGYPGGNSKPGCGRNAGGSKPGNIGNLLASLTSTDESELCDSGELTDGDAECLYSSRPNSMSSSFVFGKWSKGGGKACEPNRPNPRW